MTQRNSGFSDHRDNEQQRSSETDGPGNPPPPPVAQPKRRRKWPWIVGAIVIVLILFIALLPSLLSTSIGRALALSQVNSRINGRVEIKDWSIGWFSGISVDGLVVNDESNRQILQLPHFATKLGLLAAIRGDFNLGQTRVDGLDVLVSRQIDGSLNWEHLARGSDKAPAPVTTGRTPASPPAATAPPETSKHSETNGTKLPGVSGDLIVSNARITYEDASRQSEPVYVRNAQISVKIPDINQPINDSLSAEVQIGSQKPGTISADGTIAAVANNLVMASPSQLDQTLKLSDLDVGAVMSLLGKSTSADLSGRARGQVDIHITNGNGTAGSSIEIANVNLAHGHGPGAKPVLTNDTFSFVVNAKYAQSATSREVHVDQLKLGDTAGTFSIQNSNNQAVAILLPQNANPSAQGSIELAANLKSLNDIAQVFSAGPVTVKDPNGMELQSGTLKGSISFAQASGNQIALTGDLGITQLTVGNATATPLKNQTIALAFKAQANHDLSNVTPELHATGDLFTADITNAELDLAAPNGGAQPTPAQILKRATVQANFPSLVKVQALLRSFSPAPSSPPTKPAPSTVAMLPGPAIASAGPLPRDAVPGATTTPAVAPTMDVTGGSLSLTINANTVGKTLHVTPEIVVSNLSLKNGEQSYAMSSIHVASDATIESGVGGRVQSIQNVELAKTDVDLSDLSINGKPYEEKKLHLGIAASLNSGLKDLDLQRLTAQAVTTNAFTATIQGKITDLGSSQKIENVLKMDLSYDAEQILKLAVPLLSSDLQKRLKDAVASGKYHEPFEVRGSYPAGKPFNDAVQQLALSGRLQVDSFEGAGVSMTKLDLPIAMNGGFARIIYADKPTGQNLPPAAGFNGGTLTLAGSQIDLRGAIPTLTTVGNLRLIDNAGLNPVFAAWSLGTILSNPLFFEADKATGYLTITLVNCQGLPLDSSLTSAQGGTATLDLSIKQLTVVNGLIEKMSSVAHFDPESIRGDIPKWRIMINQGIADQDLTMTIGQNQRPMHMFGKVRLSDQEMLPLTVDLPWKLFGIKGVPRGFDSSLPEGIQIPMTGPISKPQFAFDFNKMLTDSAGKDLGKVIPGILGGNKGAGNGSDTQPASNDPLKSLGDLLDQATKKKKKK